MQEKKAEKFLLSAIERVKRVMHMDNELARLSALNGLLGFLEGGLEAMRSEQDAAN